MLPTVSILGTLEAYYDAARVGFVRVGTACIAEPAR